MTPAFSSNTAFSDWSVHGSHSANSSTSSLTGFSSVGALALMCYLLVTSFRTHVLWRKGHCLPVTLYSAPKFSLAEISFQKDGEIILLGVWKSLWTTDLLYENHWSLSSEGKVMSDKSLGLYKGINEGCLCVNTSYV